MKSTTGQPISCVRHHSDKGRLLSPQEVLAQPRLERMMNFYAREEQEATRLRESQSPKSARKENSLISNMPKRKSNGRKTSKKKENGDAPIEKLMELSVPAHREIRLTISSAESVKCSVIRRFSFPCAGIITIESTPIPKTLTDLDTCLNASNLRETRPEDLGVNHNWEF